MKDFKGFFEDQKAKFILVFAGVFLATFLILYFMGFVPSELAGGGSTLDSLRITAVEQFNGGQAPSLQEETPAYPGEEPVRIIAEKVGIDVRVESPKSADNAILNQYLSLGAVHYPGSALLGSGNVFIFGHSSNWAVVQNKAYKALNGIEKLERGDLIYVESEMARYVYEVSKVYKASADEAFVDFSKKDNMLTLSTCDIFGQKQNRFVAEAVFKEKISL